MTEFVPVKEFEGYLEISRLGVIKRGKHVFKHTETTAGYWRVNISIKNKKYYRFVHRLLAIAFLPNPENKPYINHIDGNPKNNSLENLEWCTAAENNLHAFRVMGRKPVKSWLGKSGKPHNKSKTVFCVTLGREFGSSHEAARELGLHQGNVAAVCRGEVPHTGHLKFIYVEK